MTTRQPAPFVVVALLLAAAAGATYEPPNWPLGLARYTAELSVHATDNNFTGIEITPDGTTALLVGAVSDRLYALTMSTPQRIATGAFTSSVPLGLTGPAGVCTWTDGTSYYVFVTDNPTDSVVQFQTGPNWALTTFVQVASRFVGLGAEGSTVPHDCAWRQGGTKFYLVDQGELLFEFDAATPGSLVGLTLLRTLSLFAVEHNPRSISFSADDRYFYSTGISTNQLHGWAMTDAGNIATATYAETAPQQFVHVTEAAIAADGTTAYVVDVSPARIVELDLSPITKDCTTPVLSQTIWKGFVMGVVCP